MRPIVWLNHRLIDGSAGNDVQRRHGSSLRARSGRPELAARCRYVAVGQLVLRVLLGIRLVAHAAVDLTSLIIEQVGGPS